MIRTLIFGAAGRMGRRLVANVLGNPGFELAGAVEYSASPDLGKDAGVLAGLSPCGVAVVADAAPLFPQCDVVVNFATTGVVECARAAVRAGAAVVIGTTALSADDRAELGRLAAAGGRIVAASNMSVGVNLLFKLAREATKILGNSYDVEIVEMHHNQKKDAPSGTAVRLAEVICDERQWNYEEDVRHGRVGMVGKRGDREIGMHSLRGGDVVGDHTVIFATEGERIELTHKASSRDTFARGALRAAAFLIGAAPGLYDMQDVLELK
ncbi:MAG: 4-hydroxy-tetrahydrodipicolinate reductase [Victivallaceae bacterium]|nr:4-hydroxy-tetrahydrodipicolinate reductase [Victivallaceae bacterium]